MGKRKLVALLSLSPWCLVIVVWLFLAVTCVCLQFVIVVFPDHTHLLFLIKSSSCSMLYPCKIGSDPITIIHEISCTQKCITPEPEFCQYAVVCDISLRGKEN